MQVQTEYGNAAMARLKLTRTRDADEEQLPERDGADAIAIPPPIVLLRGPENSETWLATLHRNLRYHGLEGFLDGSEDEDDDGDGDDGDDRRKLARAIVKCSLEPVAWAMRAGGFWDSSSYVDGDGHHHRGHQPAALLDAALAYVAHVAAQSGLVAQLVHRLCRADRQDCDSLAAYQRQLTELRRRLAHLRSGPGDAFLVWVAVNGLRASNPRWHRQLVAEAAEGRLDWGALMQTMAAKACREQQPSPVKSDDAE